MRSPASNYSQILSLIPGRVRIHLPAWKGDACAPIAEALRELPGIQTVEANPITLNVLIRFDPKLLDAETILLFLQPFGSLHGSEKEFDGWELVEQIRTVATLTRLLVQIRTASTLRGGVARSVALEGVLFLFTLVVEPLGVPLMGLNHLHFLFDLLNVGSVIALSRARAA